METFYSKYKKFDEQYYPNNSNRINQIENIVIGFNKDLKKHVEKAKEKHNLRIRSLISDKTGLSLTARRPENSIDAENTAEKSSITIWVNAKVPKSLSDVLAKYDDQVLDLLLHYSSMKSSITELHYQLSKHNDFRKISNTTVTETDLKNTIQYLTGLKQMIEDTGIIDELRALGPDVIGGYSPNNKRVELFWLGIGFSSLLYNYTIEDFVIIALTHELVHGYTHLGFDKDGNMWKPNDFLHSDINIVEGFAQFYTQQICKDYYPATAIVFEEMLPHQSYEYKSFTTWFSESESNKNEKARRVLLKTRNSSVLDYSKFLLILEQAKKSF